MIVKKETENNVFGNNSILVWEIKMNKWLKRKLRLAYRLLVLGWHTTVEQKFNSNQWSVVNKNGSLIFTSRYFELEEDAYGHIEFYELSEGVYLHSKLTISNLVKSFNRFARSDEGTELFKIFKKCKVTFGRPGVIKKIHRKYVKDKNGKRKLVYKVEE